MDLFLPSERTDRFVIYLTEEVTGEQSVASLLSVLEPLLAELGLGAVALAPRSSWWLPKPVRRFPAAETPEAYLVEHVVGELRARYGARSLSLLGVGMGGQGALRIAFKYPRLFPAVAAVQPWIDFHQRYWEDDVLQEVFPDVETARQYTATLWINPLDRPLHIHLFADSSDTEWYRGVERLHEKLVAIGVPHDWTVISPGRDRVAEAVQAALRWLAPRF